MKQFASDKNGGKYHSLYLAVPLETYDDLFQILFIQKSLKRHAIDLIIYDPIQEEITAWISFNNTDKIIRQVLTEQSHPYSHSNDVETEIICDTEHDHYQLAYIGWEDQKRIFSLILHFDIKDGKIWIQYNGTETAIAQVLKDKGIPASDIVLGFHSPFKRQFSGYAIA